jgi:hypothetical protein
LASAKLCGFTARGKYFKKILFLNEFNEIIENNFKIGLKLILNFAELKQQANYEISE